MFVNKRHIRVIWQLFRPLTLVLIYVQVALSVVVIGVQPTIAQVALLAVVIAFWYAHAVAINDISDVDTDTINLNSSTLQQDRPLINRSTNLRELWFISWIVVVIALTCSVFLGAWAVVVCGMILGLNFVYSLRPLRLSARGAVAQLVLPLGYVVFPAVLVASIAGGGNLYYWLFICGLYIVFSGRLFLKDIRDEVGDRQTGKLTYLVRHSHKSNSFIAATLITAGMVIMCVVLPSRGLSTIGLAILCSVGVWYFIRLMNTQQILDSKLVYVALVGRVASAWTFACLVWVALSNYTQLSMLEKNWFFILSMFIFGMGLYRLYEELPKKFQNNTTE